MIFWDSQKTSQTGKSHEISVNSETEALSLAHPPPVMEEIQQANIPRLNVAAEC
jgi:hypothetical protein